MSPGDPAPGGKPFPPVVFVSPITPSFTGNGLAMRAASLVEALASQGCSIRLLVIPMQERDGSPWDAEVTALCRSHARVARRRPPAWMRWRRRLKNMVGLGRGNPYDAVADQFRKRDMASAIGSSHGEVLFVFRLFTLGLLPRHHVARHDLWLDLDEIDSAAAGREAHLARADGKEQAGHEQACRAAYFLKLEQRLVPSAQWISVSSEVELRRLPAGSRAQAVVLPNVVRERAALLPPVDRAAEPARLLFIASYGHPPNADAVKYFCREILPLLSQRLSRPLEFLVAGSDPHRALLPLQHFEQVRLLGFVENLPGLYEEADLVVVPLRSGAGTRLKILEAFSYRRCVVSTSVGAEGLGATSGSELLLADTPAAFAEACATLLESPSRRNAIARTGHDFYRRNHTPVALRAALHRYWDGRA